MACDVPLEVLTLDGADRAELAALYKAKAALVRSDHHVVWRGDEPPADPGR